MQAAQLTINYYLKSSLQPNKYIIQRLAKLQSSGDITLHGVVRYTPTINLVHAHTLDILSSNTKYMFKEEKRCILNNNDNNNNIYIYIYIYIY